MRAPRASAPSRCVLPGSTPRKSGPPECSSGTRAWGPPTPRGVTLFRSAFQTAADAALTVRTQQAAAPARGVDVGPRTKDRTQHSGPDPGPRTMAPGPDARTRPARRTSHPSGFDAAEERTSRVIVRHTRVGPQPHAASPSSGSLFRLPPTRRSQSGRNKPPRRREVQTRYWPPASASSSRSMRARIWRTSRSW
jgi:hypothetical protein